MTEVFKKFQLPGATVPDGYISAEGMGDSIREIADDQILSLGTDGDQVLVNRSATLAANTALTGALIGTPVTSALAANSLILSNITASGDILVAINRGGNSEEYVFADGSAGTLTLTAPLGNLDLKCTVHNKPVRIRSTTFTGTLSSSIIGFQSKPGAGANASAEVIGGEISPRINDTFTGTSIIGLHVDCYLKGTTGNLSADVRGMQIELTDDTGSSRTVAGYMTHLRLRSNMSCTVTGKYSAIRVENEEGTKAMDALIQFTAGSGCLVEASGTVGGTQDKALKVIIDTTTYYIPLHTTVS